MNVKCPHCDEKTLNAKVVYPGQPPKFKCKRCHKFIDIRVYQYKKDKDLEIFVDPSSIFDLVKFFNRMHYNYCIVFLLAFIGVGFIFGEILKSLHLL